MSKEKTLKERLESLEDEIRALKYSVTRLSDILDQDLKIRLTEEQHLSEIHNILERFTRTDIKLDPKILQSFYALTINALNDSGLVLTLKKLDDVCYRLSERLKEMVAIRKEEQLEARRLRHKIKEKLEEG
jgi:predicted RNase H-like nuclease (RuvC/YqgF family)